MRYLIYLFWLLLIVLGVSFSALNSESVHLDYYLGDSNIFLPLLLVIVLIIGISLGAIMLSKSLVKSRFQNLKLKNRLKDAEVELQNLRAMPVKDTH